MDILQQIIANKKADLADHKKLVAAKEFAKSPFFAQKINSLKNKLSGSNLGIIAEFKRKSPSKGIINQKADVAQVVKGYELADVAAVSVLTDHDFFMGSLQDLEIARSAIKSPLLRKDFIIDEYQILQAKALGADLVLLIASALEPGHLKGLAEFSKNLGLEVLLEVVSKEEIDNYLCDDIDFVGVNNRNLRDFSERFEVSLDLAKNIPPEFISIAESAISQVNQVVKLKEAGFRGFLIGEAFMKNNDPALACKTFVEDLNSAIAAVEK